jgi:hypothetical protein
MGDVRIDSRDIGWEAVDWVHLQDMDKWLPPLNTVMNFRVP